MIRLPPFVFRAARTIAEAADWLAEAPAETMLLSGGTDVIPNMKRRQQVPRVLIGLRGTETMRRVHWNGSLTIGAGVTLTHIVGDPAMRETCRGLWQAAAQVATPHLRNMGTIGGNLCLDTRCNYYDQSLEWRRAIDYCMKKDGATCWVAPSSTRCLAVSSTDTAPMVIALGARVRLVSAAGQRTIDADALYHNDGMHYLTRRPDEILTDITVGDLAGVRSAYWKLRRRGSFDFPVASAALAARLTPDGRVETARLVLGAVASRPILSTAAAEVLHGQVLTDEVITAAAEAAYVVAKPMDNTDFELVWRKKMVRTLVTCALREIRGDDMREMRMKLTRQSML